MGVQAVIGKFAPAFYQGIRVQVFATKDGWAKIDKTFPWVMSDGKMKNLPIVPLFWLENWAALRRENLNVWAVKPPRKSKE